MQIGTQAMGQGLTGGVPGVAVGDAGLLNSLTCARIVQVRRYLVVHRSADLGILHGRHHYAGQHLRHKRGLTIQ
jgi:hypothetical protein